MDLTDPETCFLRCKSCCKPFRSKQLIQNFHHLDFTLNSEEKKYSSFLLNIDKKGMLAYIFDLEEKNTCVTHITGQ
jgi:hypothetical protein